MVLVSDSISRYLLYALILFSVNSIAQETACPDRSDAQPTTPIESDVQSRRIAALSPTWKGDETARFTWFSAYVGTNGRLDIVCCFSSSLPITNVEIGALRPKLAKLRFTRAIHDEKHLRTFINFTIIGVRRDSGIESRLYLNQQHLKEKYGIEYIAPQRVGRFGRYRSGRLSAVFAVDVNANGAPSNPRVIRWDIGTDGAKARFLSYIGQECFIPGFVNGKPVGMSYFEAFERW